MARETSMLAYNKIRESGLLGNMQILVYETVWQLGSCTSAEAIEDLRQRGYCAGPLSQFRARFTELREMGVLCEIGQRKCNVTGRTAIVWDVADHVPVTPARKLKPYDRGYNQAVDDIVAKIGKGSRFLLNLKKGLICT